MNSSELNKKVDLKRMITSREHQYTLDEPSVHLWDCNRNV